MPIMRADWIKLMIARLFTAFNGGLLTDDSVFLLRWRLQREM